MVREDGDRPAGHTVHTEKIAHQSHPAVNPLVLAGPEVPNCFGTLRFLQKFSRNWKGNPMEWRSWLTNLGAWTASPYDLR